MLFAVICQAYCSVSVQVGKTNNLDLDRVHFQLECQHRKYGATQQLSQVKIQINPAVTNSWRLDDTVVRNSRSSN